MEEEPLIPHLGGICNEIPFHKFCNFICIRLFNSVDENKYKNSHNFSIFCLTLSQTIPGLYVFAVQLFKKHCGKKRNCS